MIAVVIVAFIASVWLFVVEPFIDELRRGHKPARKARPVDVDARDRRRGGAVQP